MSSAPTDCRVPDPTDAKADGQFQAVNRRAGYGDDRLDRIIATARKGWTLAAGEGLVLVQEIDRLRDDLKYAQALLNQLHDSERLQDENDRLREERDAIAKRFTGACDMSRQYAQTYGIDRAGDNVFQTMRDDAERQRRILAALRNPSDLMVDALREQIYDLSCFDEALKAIRVAVAAAEHEVGA